MTSELHSLRAADFTPYLHQFLAIRFTPEVRLEAELIEVKETENYTGIERTPFFIVLRTGQKQGYYPQGIYTVEHPEKGDLHIFLVPLGPDAKGIKYEAVFS